MLSSPIIDVKRTVSDIERPVHATGPKTPLHTLTDWDGPDDLENPPNWRFAIKLYATVEPALYAFVV